jgi:hypothetical protein
VCNWRSFLVLRDGKLVTNWLTDSHEHLIAWQELSDGNDHLDHFVRGEFTPPMKDDRLDYANVDGYTLKVDEQEAPAWFDADMRQGIHGQLADMVRGMIVADHRSILMGGQWILVDGAVVDTCQSAIIHAMHNSAQVRYMYDSAQVGYMYDSAQVGYMYNSAQVRSMYDSAQVGSMHDSAQVRYMYNSSAAPRRPVTP